MPRVDALYVVLSLARFQHGVVTAEQCGAAGVSGDLIRSLCRAGEWIRLNRGVYLVDANLLDGVPRLSEIWAAALSVGPSAVAVLATAAELHGIAGLRRDDDVHLSLPGSMARNRRPTEPGVRLHQFVLSPNDTTTVEGLRVTTPARTVADLLLRIHRFTAVSLLDSALNRRLLLPEDVGLVRAMMTGRRGAPQARPWLAEADARAESPLETRVRLRACDGGVPPDELQYRVRDQDGNVIAIADMAWTWARVVGEADGAEAHDNPVAVFRDRKRQNDIVNAGYIPLRFTWEDTLTVDYIPSVVRGAIARSRAA
jgi:very-short-patch-repair endonuclease